MRALLALLSALLVSVTPTRSWAQPSEYVFKIRTGLCKDGSKGKTLSGFRLQAGRGIYTALHGVVGCSDIRAEFLSSSRAVVWSELEIKYVDADLDVAVLSSEELDADSTRANLGLPQAKNPDWNSIKKLRTLGYPKGISGQLESSSLTVRSTPRVRLNQLLPPGDLKVLGERKSPNVTRHVLSLEGHLIPGHSGAPVLIDESKQVGAIVIGGLDEGRIEISWAVPMGDLNLVEPGKVDRSLWTSLERGQLPQTLVCDAEGDSSRPPLPKLSPATMKEARVIFKQTSNNKDWDTQVITHLKCPYVVARLECCSSDRDHDGWDDPGTEVRSMQIVDSTFPISSLSACTFTVGSRASGNDKWEFVPTLQLVFSDGTKREQSFTQTNLNSREGGYVEASYQITITR
ncbi:trypsin-like peptidase domain-containing protein [Archangium sp.]|uniref:trypsin-like peptidase domain-containing protein n=1 Tax=Archangium sp. TaxID=1872627 RepID=UPI00389AEF79